MTTDTPSNGDVELQRASNSTVLQSNHLASIKEFNQSRAQCPTCGKVFEDLKVYINHFEDCEPMSCCVCNHFVCDYERLKIHMWNAHRSLIHQCKYCLFVSYEITSRVTHYSQICLFRDILECEYCPRIFKNFIHASHHEVLHSDDPWFECAYCSFKTPMRVKLMSHQDRHLEEDVGVLCPYCAWGSNNINRILQHIIEYHFGKLIL